MILIFKEKQLIKNIGLVCEMILEISFGLAGGVNFALEESWNLIKNIISKYPDATWTRIVNRRKGKGKYIVEIN